MKKQAQDEKLIIQLYAKIENLDLSPYQKESFDLLKCIQTYRSCPSLETLLNKKPYFVYQLSDLYKLWKKFDNMKPHELSDLSIKLIHDILELENT